MNYSHGLAWCVYHNGVHNTTNYKLYYISYSCTVTIKDIFTNEINRLVGCIVSHMIFE